MVDITGKCQRKNNGELHDLYCSPNVIQVAKSKIMGCMGHDYVSESGEVCTGFW